MTNSTQHVFLITIGCVLLLASTSLAETPEPYKLDNGLTVILRPVPTVNKAAFVVLFNLGSDQDPIGKSGMVHLTAEWIQKAEGDYTTVKLLQAIRPSTGGLDREQVHELRAPAIYCEDGKTWLLYSVAGEQGIAIMQLTL